ncbi:MAG: Flp family type IVb pilin [Alphaproteobacteria bacterium]
MRSVIASFRRDESGATVVEYGLITALIAVSIIVSATAVGIAINSNFQGLADDNFTEDAGEVGQN